MIAIPAPEPVTFPLDLTPGLSAREADRRVAQCHRAGDTGARGLAFYLADMADRGVYQELGFHSIELYAEVRYHIAPSTTRQYIRVGRSLRDLPEIDRAFFRGRLFWSQVRELARVATPETEEEWIRFAQGRPARQLAAQVARRRKGERPTDPSKRRIHEARFRPEGRMNAVQWAKWNAARQKLEAELDRPVSDAEILEHAADVLLSTRPDGSVAGRIAVNDSHYKIVVFHDIRWCRSSIEVDGTREPIDARTALSVFRASDRPDLAELFEQEADGDGDKCDEYDVDDPHENDGSEVPMEQRDKPVNEALRREILARDGYRCLICFLRDRLSCHHKKQRKYGGRTVPKNLMTACDDCHSLIHAGFIIVRGTISRGLRFLNTEGRELHELGPSVRETIERMTLQLDARASRDFPGKSDDARASDPAGEGPGMDDLVGQKAVVEVMRRAARAARGRGEPLGHTLLCGPAGSGKTSIALAVAREMGTRARLVLAASVSEPADLACHVADVDRGGILFVDEAHRLPPRVAESLYPAMDAAAITVIGATTHPDMLPRPFRSRFTIRQDLEDYGLADLVEIIRRGASRLGVAIDQEAATVLAAASRDTPREALALLRHARDETQLRGEAAIAIGTAKAALESLGVDEHGFGRVERSIVSALRGGPLGLGTLADSVGCSRAELLEVHEPLLIRRGLLVRTRRGRMLVPVRGQ